MNKGSEIEVRYFSKVESVSEIKVRNFSKEFCSQLNSFYGGTLVLCPPSLHSDFLGTQLTLRLRAPLNSKHKHGNGVW